MAPLRRQRGSNFSAPAKGARFQMNSGNQMSRDQGTSFAFRKEREPENRVQMSSGKNHGREAKWDWI